MTTLTQKVYTPEEIEALPRLRPRHGGTYTLLTPDLRELVASCVPNFQLTHHLAHTPFTVYDDHYVDCGRCRSDRARLGARLLSFADANGDLNYHYNDDFWCNTCQGSGWVRAPVEDEIVRLNIRMWRHVAMEWSMDELMARHAKSYSKLMYANRLQEVPKQVVANEMARRLTARED